MSEKSKIIKEMLEMQKKFMERERSTGVSAEEYFAGDMVDYRKKYNDLANRVNELAHAEKGSHR